TEDSSFGGAAGASGGFSAGLDSCAQAFTALRLNAVSATSSTPTLWLRFIGLSPRSRLVLGSVKPGILTVSTKSATVLFYGAKRETLHHCRAAPRSIPRSYPQSSRRRHRGVLRHPRQFATRLPAHPRLRPRQGHYVSNVLDFAALHFAVLHFVIGIGQQLPDRRDAGLPVCLPHYFVRVKSMLACPPRPHPGHRRSRVHQHAVQIKEHTAA